MNSPLISIIIVSYNVKEFVLSCLASIQKADLRDKAEIILVDNNSSDDTVRAVSASFPLSRVIANDFNAGFSGANNQGIREAKGEYIFLLNPDTEIFNDTLQKLEAFMQADKEVSIAAPRLLNSDGSLQQSAWPAPSAWNIVLETFFLHSLFMKKYELAADANREVYSASGAALFFRKSLVGKIGYLDENLFWMEDVDFCRRAKEYGKIMYVPSAKVIHHSGKSSLKNYNTSVSNQLISKLKFFRKYKMRVSYVIGSFFAFLHIVSRILLFLLLSPVSQKARLKFSAYVFTLRKFAGFLLHQAR